MRANRQTAQVEQPTTQAEQRQMQRAAQANLQVLGVPESHCT